MLSWCWYDSTPLTFCKSNKPFCVNSKCFIYLWISSSSYWFWDRSHEVQAYHVNKDDLELPISFLLLPVTGIRVWGLSPSLCLQPRDNKVSQTSRTKTVQQASHPIKRAASYHVNSLAILTLVGISYLTGHHCNMWGPALDKGRWCHLFPNQQRASSNTMKAIQ